MRTTERRFAVACLLACCGVAFALPPPLQDVASSMPASERERLAGLQRRLQAMPAPERLALRADVAQWDALADAERRSRRDAWQAWQSLPQGERQRMRAARAAYDAMALEEQQAIRARFDALDANLRRGWLLGPSLGADWPRLHALFAQVPEDGREALLAALHALDAQGRDDLAVLAQRTSPEEREALRTALLAQPVGERDAWLRARVDP